MVNPPPPKLHYIHTCSYLGKHRLLAVNSLLSMFVGDTEANFILDPTTVTARPLMAVGQRLKEFSIRKITKF